MRTKHLPIADPCHEDWSSMDRVERGRFCQVCVKQVYDLSSMTEREARGILRGASGTRICVRYRHDDEGRIRFASTQPASTCPAPPRWARAGAVVLAAAMAACTPHDNPDVPRPADPSVIEKSRNKRSLTEDLPQAQTRVTTGQVVAIEPEHELLGDVAAPEPEPEPEPVVMGKPVAIPLHEVKGDIAAPALPDEPCDGAPAPR